MLRRTTWFPTKVKGELNSTDNSKFDIRLDFSTAQTAPISSFIFKCSNYSADLLFVPGISINGDDLISIFNDSGIMISEEAQLDRLRTDIAKCRLGAQKYVTLIHDECPEYVVNAFGYLSGFNLAPSSYVFLDSLLKAFKQANIPDENIDYLLSDYDEYYDAEVMSGAEDGSKYTTVSSQNHKSGFDMF